MAPPKGSTGKDSPREEPQGNPVRDLHPVADIRLVIVDLAKLTERIDNLIERVGDLKVDGKETRDSLFEIKESIASFKGGMKVASALYALALVLVASFLAWFLRPDAPPPTTNATTVTPTLQTGPAHKDEVESLDKLSTNGAGG